MLGSESGNLGDTPIDEVVFELDQVAVVSGNGGRRALLGFEKLGKLLQGSVETNGSG